jgi:chemotaxis protein MotB
MKNNNLKSRVAFSAKTFAIVFFVLFLGSCVPARLLEESKQKSKECEDNLAKLKTESREIAEQFADLKENNEKMNKQIKQLEADTLSQGKFVSKLTKNYDKLNDTYNLLLEKNTELEQLNKNENKRLAGDLQLTQDQLQRKEDKLRKLEEDLDKREKTLKTLEEDLGKSNEQLALRELKVRELQSILSKKDSAVSALKSKVSDALLGFVDKGLTVNQKNGKVYVSLEESLLFASGSIIVDAKGMDPLKKLAKVLEQNADINVLIEGHTDDVPFNSAGGSIKDNWELSVLRATSIVKIILNNSKVDPKRIEAAGRGEYLPIDTGKNAEARKKNRRTEIILTPNLNELLKILEQN